MGQNSAIRWFRIISQIIWYFGLQPPSVQLLIEYHLLNEYWLHSGALPTVLLVSLEIHFKEPAIWVYIPSYVNKVF